jgi:predicted transglutaminase-like cysteine proteinase
MPVSLRLRAAAHVVVICSLVSLCGGAATARTVPDMQIAALTPADIAIPMIVPSPAPPPRHEPFGLTLSSDGPMWVRWRSLQPAIRAEMQFLALCRSHSAICSPAATRFLAIVNAGLARSGRARLGEINRAVNLAIRPMSDLAQYGALDVWATPLMTFSSGAGDCEDYAIAKYVALRQTGIATEDVRLVIVHDRQTGEDHAVTAARLDGRWLILDNRTMMLRVDSQEFFLTPLVALGDGESDRPPVAASTPKPRPLFDTGLLIDNNG